MGYAKSKPMAVANAASGRRRTQYVPQLVPSSADTRLHATQRAARAQRKRPHDRRPLGFTGWLFSAWATGADHRNRHAIGLRNRRQCLASSPALDGFGPLVVGKFALATELDASALARSRPAPVRSRISSRSNSAMAANIVASKRPWAPVVSNSGSPSDRNEAPALPIRSISSSSSRVERPSGQGL